MWVFIVYVFLLLKSKKKGLDDALGSVARALAPLVAGVLLDVTNSARPSYLLSSLLFFGVSALSQ